MEAEFTTTSSQQILKCRSEQFDCEIFVIRFQISTVFDKLWYSSVFVQLFKHACLVSDLCVSLFSAFDLEGHFLLGMNIFREVDIAERSGADEAPKYKPVFNDLL